MGFFNLPAGQDIKRRRLTSHNNNKNMSLLHGHRKQRYSMLYYYTGVSECCYDASQSAAKLRYYVCVCVKCIYNGEARDVKAKPGCRLIGSVDLCTDILRVQAAKVPGSSDWSAANTHTQTQRVDLHTPPPPTAHPSTHFLRADVVGSQ